MRAITQINQVVAISTLVVTLLLVASCKKPDQHATSPWVKKAIGITTPEHGIGEMSTYQQTTCYGLLADFSGVANLHDITFTHDGGKTWQTKTIEGMENNTPFGVAATTEDIVHVFGYDTKSGGGNVFRSMDGGNTWQREAANAYTDPASFPDVMHFFNPQDGVIFGDPQNGYYEIYTTSDGGNNWSRVPSDNIPDPLPNEYGVPYHSDSYMNTVWMLTSTMDSAFNPVSSRLLQSDDKGVTWYVKNASLTTNGYDGSIKFRNHSVGLYKNNEILYRTTDGGTTWNVVNYIGKWFSYDLDNVPGITGCWISTGGGTLNPPNPLSAKGFGSSITYDDGDHWTTLDSDVNHTCVDMTSPIHGYSGGVTSGNGDDGVFVYKPLNRLGGEFWD